MVRPTSIATTPPKLKSRHNPANAASAAKTATQNTIRATLAVITTNLQQKHAKDVGMSKDVMVVVIQSATGCVMDFASLATKRKKWGSRRMQLSSAQENFRVAQEYNAAKVSDLSQRLRDVATRCAEKGHLNFCTYWDLDVLTAAVAQLLELDLRQCGYMCSISDDGNRWSIDLDWSAD